VLQIVAGADFALGIAPGGRTAPRKPRAALAAAAVAEREPLLEPAPIGLGADGEPQPSGAGFEVRVADGAVHCASPKKWGAFGEYPWTNANVPPRTKNARNIDDIDVC